MTFSVVRQEEFVNMGMTSGDTRIQTDKNYMGREGDVASDSMVAIRNKVKLQNYLGKELRFLE